MICLKPSSGIKKKFPLDFDVLSNIFSVLQRAECKRCHRIEKVYNVVVRLVKGGWSYFQNEPGLDQKIWISEEVQEASTLIVVLVHELRHIFQDKIFKLPQTKKMYDDSTTQKYKNSPAEIDAIMYERLLKYKVLRCYKQMIKQKTKLYISIPFNAKRNS